MRVKAIKDLKYIYYFLHKIVNYETSILPLNHFVHLCLQTT